MLAVDVAGCNMFTGAHCAHTSRQGGTCTCKLVKCLAMLIDDIYDNGAPLTVNSFGISCLPRSRVALLHLVSCADDQLLQPSQHREAAQDLCQQFAPTSKVVQGAKGNSGETADVL